MKLRKNNKNIYVTLMSSFVTGAQITLGRIIT